MEKVNHLYFKTHHLEHYLQENNILNIISKKITLIFVKFREIYRNIQINTNTNNFFYVLYT